MAKTTEKEPAVETPKIEKLGVTQLGNEGLNQMAEKINEIVDVLNNK